jgi:predicted TIM-barrel fold metal-dependent hydrolase
MRIVDPHVHIWDLSTGLYPGLEKPSTGFVGNNAAIARSYLLPELIAEAGAAGDLDLAGIVHVEAFPTDRIAETRYLQQLADGPGHGFPQALVVNVDLAADDAEAQLEAQCAFANTRGVRQVVNQHVVSLYSYGVPDHLNNPLWRRNFSLLKRFGLSFDLQLYPHQIDDALAIRMCRSFSITPACRAIERATGLPNGNPGSRPWQNAPMWPSRSAVWACWTIRGRSRRSGHM